MPKSAGCLIGIPRRFVVILAGVKCGKGKFIGSSSFAGLPPREFLEAKAESCAEIHH